MDAVHADLGAFFGEFSVQLVAVPGVFLEGMENVVENSVLSEIWRVTVKLVKNSEIWPKHAQTNPVIKEIRI